MTEPITHSPAVSDVLTRDARRYQAMVMADTATLEELLDERLLYTHSNGDLDTKQSYIAAVSSGDFVYTDITHHNHHVVAEDDVIVLVGTMHADVTIRGARKSLANTYLGVWLSGQSGWRQVAYQTTPLPR